MILTFSGSAKFEGRTQDGGDFEPKSATFSVDSVAQATERIARLLDSRFLGKPEYDAIHDQVKAAAQNGQGEINATTRPFEVGYNAGSVTRVIGTLTVSQ